MWRWWESRFFFLVAFPIWIAVDAWRFPAHAWQVAGQRQWVWRVLPLALIGIALLPFGVWWFRSLVLAADACCIPYLAKVRPTLGLARFMETDTQPDVRNRASASIIRIRQ